MELGLPPPQGLTTPLGVPDFEPLWSARWVNGIWFTALGLSLSAALIAMLAKEWLSAYLSFRPRSARRRAFIRQSRLQGLEDWWALHIVDLLPTLLHASLLLFSVGLVIYLWDYDVAVAAVLSGVIGLTLTFYVVTGVLGATFEFCPFVTEVSGYIRRAALALFSPSREQRPETNNESAAPSIQDLKALLWLANNARDPSVVDHSYRAMAGLHASAYIKSTSVTAQLNSDVGPSATHEGPIYVYRESTLGSLLDTVVARFEKLMAGTLETGSGEPPISRYINAILGLSNYIHRLTSETPISGVDILYKIDMLWSSNLPPRSISGNSFTQLLITKQEVMQLVAKELITNYSTTSGLPVHERRGSTPHIYHHSAHTSTCGYAVNMYGTAAPKLTPVDLYNMFTRWLDMSVSLVLDCSRGEIFIDSYLLEGLKMAMGDAASYLDCNAPKNNLELVPGNTPSERMNIDQFTSNSHPNFDPYTSPMVSLGNNIDTLGALISNLLNCVKADPNSAAHLATLKIFNALAPIALRQLCQPDVGIENIQQSFNFQDLDSRSSFARCDLLYIVVRYAMITASYIYKVMPRHPTIIQLFDDALDVVYYAIEEDSGFNLEYGGPIGAFGRHFNDFISILIEASENESRFNLLTANTAENLCCFARHRLASNAYPCMYYLPPACTRTLLRLLASTEQLYASTIRTMLEAVLNRMRTSPTDYTHTLPQLFASIPTPRPPIEYLQQWTNSEQIFSSLIRTAPKSSKYIQPILNAITAIVQLAANRDPKLSVEPIELRPPAIQCFLQATAWVLPHLSSTQGEEENYRSFVIAASILLARAAKDEASHEILANDPSLVPILKEVKSGQGINIKGLSQAEWEGLVQKLSAGNSFARALQPEGAESSDEDEETDEDGSDGD
ncbi:hypothetical protein ACGC1H_002393 [Rhizoctonia solani]